MNLPHYFEIMVFFSPLQCVPEKLTWQPKIHPKMRFILKQFDAQLSSWGAKNISIRKYEIKGQPIRHETKTSK